MSAEIESLSTDLKSRRSGSGMSPMLVALVVIGLLLAVYAHWRFGQFDERIDRLRGQLVTLRPLRADDFEAVYAAASDPLIWEQHPSRNRYQEAVFQEFFDEAMASGGALVARDLGHRLEVASTDRGGECPLLPVRPGGPVRPRPRAIVDIVIRLDGLFTFTDHFSS